MLKFWYNYNDTHNSGGKEFFFSLTSNTSADISLIRFMVSDYDSNLEAHEILYQKKVTTMLCLNIKSIVSKDTNLAHNSKGLLTHYMRHRQPTGWKIDDYVRSASCRFAGRFIDP